MTAPKNIHRGRGNYDAGECWHGVVFYCFAILNINFSSSFFEQKSKFTLSRRVSRSQQNESAHAKGSGVGWSDDGIAMHNGLYDCVAKDRKNCGDSFDKELLNVHQARRRKKEKESDCNLDNQTWQKRTAKDDLAMDLDLKSVPESEG